MREIKPKDVIQYQIGRTSGHATVKEVYKDLLATGDRWYLTNGNPRWISHDQLTVR